MLIGCGDLVLHSVYYLAHPSEMAHGSATWQYAGLCLREITVILLLWYVLSRTARNWRSLGWEVSWKGALVGAGLAVAAYVAYVVLASEIALTCRVLFGHYPAQPDVQKMLAGVSPIVMVPFVLLVNPFFEEVLVRGYFMTELRQLTGAVFIAGAASVLLQSSYHLYQGWYAATCTVALFSVFAVYYGMTRRLFPVVIGHMLLDIHALIRMHH